ncbi:DEAD-box ATP-dependent RNA helicase 37 [Pelomyxa schiedti]|nr:DEAD-box ATP-dependent RNA helicase 37 [Pelomyxa schiedti]
MSIVPQPNSAQPQQDAVVVPQRQQAPQTQQQQTPTQAQAATCTSSSSVSSASSSSPVSTTTTSSSSSAYSPASSSSSASGNVVSFSTTSGQQPHVHINVQYHYKDQQQQQQQQQPPASSAAVTTTSSNSNSSSFNSEANVSAAVPPVVSGSNNSSSSSAEGGQAQQGDGGESRAATPSGVSSPGPQQKYLPPSVRKRMEEERIAREREQQARSDYLQHNPPMQQQPQGGGGGGGYNAARQSDPRGGGGGGYVQQSRTPPPDYYRANSPQLDNRSMSPQLDYRGGGGGGEWRSNSASGPRGVGLLPMPPPSKTPPPTQVQQQHLPPASSPTPPPISISISRNPPQPPPLPRDEQSMPPNEPYNASISRSPLGFTEDTEVTQQRQFAVQRSNSMYDIVQRRDSPDNMTSYQPIRRHDSFSELPRDNFRRDPSSYNEAEDRWSILRTSAPIGGDRRYSYGGGGGGYERRSTTNDRWSRFRDSRHDSNRTERRQEWLAAHKEEISQADTHANDLYTKFPIEISGDNPPKDFFEKFSEIDLGDILDVNILAAKYVSPMPVQKAAIPIVLGGRDLMGCAQTGSGKTEAFLLPIISSILLNGPPPPPPDSDARRKAFPSCLILAPTRELADQINKHALQFSVGSPVRTVVVYGGTEIRGQLQDLQRGADILVATPGRLIDLIERARVSLCMVKYLVLDEADRMLDMGFEPAIRRIIEQEDMTRMDKRQTLMFSATFPREIQRLAQDFLRSYIFVSIGREGSTVPTIQQRIEYVEEDEKREAVVDLLMKHQGLTLIFTETKKAADMLEVFLSREGFAVNSIHGDRTQPEREFALNQFRDHRVTILVATDVCARGLDIPNVTHVINFDMPNDIDSYVHRIGRTGRAGKEGLATSFINEKSRALFRDLYDKLAESSQDIPSWFEDMSRSRPHYGGGGHGHHYGGGRGGGGGGCGNHRRASAPSAFNRNTTDFRRGNDRGEVYRHGSSSQYNDGYAPPPPPPGYSLSYNS